MARGAEVIESASLEADAGVGGKDMARVLIADDASFMRQMIREIIEPEGYEVVGEATNGIEAWSSSRSSHPDLVTMDIVMPKRSGIDAVKAHPRRAPRRPAS